MKFFFLLCVCALIASAQAQTVHIEAENGRIENAEVQTTSAGFSGTGYVGDFAREGAHVSLTLPPLKAGIYRLRVRYQAPFGDKDFEFKVNGIGGSGHFAALKEGFGWVDAGKVEIRDGSNELSIERGWGYFLLDAIELAPAPITLLKPVPVRLVDAKATAATRALYARLLRDYGRKTLSGQFEEADTQFIQQQTGVLPAIYGSDLMDYSPSRREHGTKPDGLTEATIERIKKNGQILTLTWHWNSPSGLIDATFTNGEGKTIDAPWYRGFYTEATRFDLQKALADPNGADYKLLLRDIDAIAVELKKYQAAGVPILWRPLHEAPGGWFWWGAKGPESFKTLWRILFQRLNQTHGLHNLIWTWAGYEQAEWYPGDNYVDIVGTDLYPQDGRDALAGQFDALKALYDGKKPIALCEVGGVPDTSRMKRFGVTWLYFTSWTGSAGPRQLAPDELRRRYLSPEVVNAK